MVAIRMAAIRANDQPDLEVGFQRLTFDDGKADEAVAVFEVDIGADRPVEMPIRTGLALTAGEDEIIAAAREGLRGLLADLAAEAAKRYG